MTTSTSYQMLLPATRVDPLRLAVAAYLLLVPGYNRGILGVPLFTHVYHDYVLGYGGDSAYVSDSASPLALYHQGMNLVCGKSAAVAVWSS